MKSKDLEKQYLKKVDTAQPLDVDSFTKAYLEQRVAYHKYQIYKAKVQNA